ncbi:hypothetical protein PMAYCL1PPCAC_21669, partial [Pristionchus mayeri]
RMRSLIDVLLLFLSSAFSLAFQDFFEYKLNGKEYIETVEQPWFRVHHMRHRKIPFHLKNLTSFGKHEPIPEWAQNKVEPYWTEIEKRIFPCVTRSCVCEYFRGSNATLSFEPFPSKNTCRLKDGNLLKPAIRKEIRMLTDEERMSIEKALNEIKRDGTYSRFGRVHKHNGVHSGPSFILWHREFLKRFELILRKHLPSPHTLGIPYWDSSLDSPLPEPKDSIMFTPTFLGTTDTNGHVITGPYANWTTMEGTPSITREVGADPQGEFFTQARIDFAIDQMNVNSVLAATLPLSTCLTHVLDDRLLEFSHDYVHYYIGGDMKPSWSSTNDIIFFLHHSMVDHIFELFRQHSQNRTQREKDYPKSDENCFPPVHNIDSVMRFLEPTTNRDGLSNAYTDNMYEFAPRPTCEKTRRDCGSKYLYCDVAHNSEPTCMSKIRSGGNCTGFEGMEVCFGSECMKGK